jgi:hypothetical protein
MLVCSGRADLPRAPAGVGGNAVAARMSPIVTAAGIEAIFFIA